MSRVYNQKDIFKWLSTMELVAAVTVSIAPCTPALFIGIKFEPIKGWIVDQNNFAYLSLAIVNLLFLIFCYFGLSNLTVEPTFKLVKKSSPAK